MNRLSQPTLDRIVGQTVSNKHIHGAVFQVAFPDQPLALTSAAGNIPANGFYYIASINKLFLSAITLRLYRDGKLNLTDMIANYLPADTVLGLLVYKGRDYSGQITIAHLISHTSGLPCYLIDKRGKKPKVMEELLHGIDQEWPTDRVIAQVKQMRPKFLPGQKGKANYANTNFRLMGKILEALLQKPIATILTNVFDELKLQHTFVLRHDEERTFTPVYVKEKPIHIPRYLSSSGYDIVSTAGDQIGVFKGFY